MALGQIRRMGGQFIGHHADFHIIAVRQAKMLFGRYIAQHGGAKPANHACANSRSDMVIAGRNIGGERAEGVERGLVTNVELFGDVLVDFMHGHMARTFDHHLTALVPGDFGQLAQGFQLGKLRFVIGVRNGTGAQAVAKAERYIIGAHNVANVLKVLVEEALFMMVQAPFGHDRSTARNNAGHPVGGQVNKGQTHPRMDGEIVHPLLGLFDQCIGIDFPG